MTAGMYVYSHSLQILPVCPPDPTCTPLPPVAASAFSARLLVNPICKSTSNDVS